MRCSGGGAGRGGVGPGPMQGGEEDGAQTGGEAGPVCWGEQWVLASLRVVGERVDRAQSQCGEEREGSQTLGYCDSASPQQKVWGGFLHQEAAQFFFFFFSLPDMQE